MCNTRVYHEHINVRRSLFCWAIDAASSTAVCGGIKASSCIRCAVKSAASVFLCDPTKLIAFSRLHHSHRRMAFTSSKEILPSWLLCINKTIRSSRVRAGLMYTLSHASNTKKAAAVATFLLIGRPAAVQLSIVCSTRAGWLSLPVLVDLSLGIPLLLVLLAQLPPLGRDAFHYLRHPDCLHFRSGQRRRK